MSVISGDLPEVIVNINEKPVPLDNAENVETITETIEVDPIVLELISSNENMLDKLSKICRFCLAVKEDMKSLFDEADCLSVLLPILSSSAEVSPNDGLPGNVCLECSTKLSKSVEFINQIENSEVVLRRLLFPQCAKIISFEESALEQLKINIESSPVDLVTNSIDQSFLFSPLMEEPLIPTDLSLTLEEASNCGIAEVPEQDSVMPESLNSDEDSLSTLREYQINVVDDNSNQKVIAKTSKSVDDSNLNQQFSCSLCTKTFRSHPKFIRHMKSHLENNKFTCNLCRKKFKTTTSLDSHIRCHRQIQPDNENSTNSHQCQDCEAKFVVEADLFVHSSIHSISDGKFVCRKCEKIFPSLMKLKRHLPTHFEDKPYKCDECGKGFPEMGSLTRHFRLHSGETRERKHACRFCTKKYYDSHSLSVHLRTHTGEKPWKCETCGKSFVDSRLLNSHMKIHLSEKSYSCKTCGRRFTHPSTLRTHVRTHTGEKPYKCSVCGKCFIQSSNLCLHMRMHSGEKPYKCQDCDKSFASSSSLSLHTRTHTGRLRPFRCSYCNKCFARQYIKIHLRTHTGEKPYKCGKCARTFATSSQVIQHKKTHSATKKFPCEYCDQTFPLVAALKRHVGNNHKNRSGREKRTKPAIEENSECKT